MLYAHCVIWLRAGTRCWTSLAESLTWARSSGTWRSVSCSPGASSTSASGRESALRARWEQRTAATSSSCSWNLFKSVSMCEISHDHHFSGIGELEKNTDKLIHVPFSSCNLRRVSDHDWSLSTANVPLSLLTTDVLSLCQVVYFTATAPYVFMIILLVRMAMLSGARDGLLFYLVPDFEKVAEMQVHALSY